jgi:hypothetical protein
MRKTLTLIPLLVAAVALAQEAPTPEDLVRKLGHEDYAVREEATRKLIEMGAKAQPALEAALKSEDLEVRLRAGRALSAIRRGGEERAEAPEPEGDEPFATPRRSVNRGVEVQMADGRVKIRVRTIEDGKEVVKEYEGESLDQLRKDHPELNEVLGGFRFRVQRGGAFDFDMDEFWKERDRAFNDEFWQNLHRDLERDIERQRRWLEHSRKRMEERLREDAWDLEFGEATAAGPRLGIRTSRPDAVVDAQLELAGKGLVVESVEEGSLAARLRLERYDILLELNGVEIRAPQDVAKALAAAGDGKAAAKVLRRGKVVDLAS